MTDERHITIDEIMDMQPCSGYTRNWLEELFGDLPFATPAQIAACDVPVVDRVWWLVRLLREKSHMATFAYMCAERAGGYAATNCAAKAAKAADAATYYATLKAATYYAADAAYYASSAADAYAGCSDAERQLQLDHLVELHAIEALQALQETTT